VGSWIKFYETVTKPLPVTSCLFLAVSTTFLLFAPASTLAKLGMTRVLADYRWGVGLGLVISATWLVVTALIGLAKRFRRLWLVHEAKRRLENELPQLMSIEREILGYLLASNQRVFTNTMDCGHANTLVSRGIVAIALRPGQTFTQFEMPFEIPEHVWEILLKHKAEFPCLEGTEERPYPWRRHWME
jgi:hypothetical protein